MLKHVRRGAALILSMAMFIQLGIGNNYITFASEETQTPEQTQEESQTTGEVSEESNEVSSDTQESTEPAPETEDEVTVPEKEAASTLIVQFVNEDKTNIDVNQYPDKEIALTGLYVNDPYQLVFNDHQINTQIDGYTLSKIVDAEDTQKEYPLTTMEQGYVDISLSKNITKIQLIYTKDMEPAQPPDNSQTETDSQQPSEEQEESSEEDGQQDEISQQPTINMLSVDEEVTVQISGVKGVSSTEISTGKVIAPEYPGYAFQYAQTTNGTRLDYIGTYNGEPYYAYIGDDSDYYFQPATFLTDGEQIQLVYQEVGYQIQTSIAGDNKEESNTVDIPEYCNVDGSFSITVSLARGYTASVKVEDEAIEPSQTETNRLTFNVTGVNPGENNIVDVSIKFEEVETYQYYLGEGVETAVNWHRYQKAWPDEAQIDSTPRDFKAGEAFTFYIPAPTDESAIWRLNALAINNEYVTLPDGYNYGASNDGYTLSTGTVVTITCMGNNNYKVEVDNAYEDIVVTYGNFKAEGWKEIMPNEISGVELQVWDNQHDNGDGTKGAWVPVETGKPLGYESQGIGYTTGYLPWDKETTYVITFRYKSLPGYDEAKIEATNFSYDNHIKEGESGWTYIGIKYNGNNNGYTSLNVVADYQSYHVTYNEGEQNANVPSDNLDYSISGAEGTYSQINVSNQWPTSDNANFAGWKIGNSNEIIWPGDTLQLQDILKYADRDGNITLTAQWTDKTQDPERIPYTVEVYVERQVGESGGYYKFTEEIKSGELGQRIVLIQEDPTFGGQLSSEMYELDTTQGDTGEIVLNKPGKVYKVYYSLRKFNINTKVINGTITDGGSVKYGYDRTIEYSPNENCILESVVVDGENVTDKYRNEYTFTDVTEDHRIIVTYKEKSDISDEDAFKVSNIGNEVYDGQEHVKEPTVTTADGAKTLKKDTDYTVTYKEGQNFVNVGTIEVTITGTGNYSGTVTREYRITRKPITVTTDSAIKVYDGNALTVDGRVEGIVDGETYGFVITGKQIEVGSSENTYKLEWTGSAKEGNYKITEDLGILTVVPQSIDPEDPTEPEDPDQPVYAGITVDKPEDKVYDGKEHKWMPTVTLSDGTALDPENYEVSYDTEDFVNVTGKITVTITGTGNYAGTITHEYQITPRAVTITSADDSKVYDGTPLINGNVSVTEGSLVSEEDILFKATGSQTEVGSSANTIELTYANEQMEKNYDVTLVEGTLTVTEKSAEKSEDSDSNKDSEKTDGEDTAAATNVGIFASLATSALAGMGILAALKKRRKD